MMQQMELAGDFFRIKASSIRDDHSLSRGAACTALNEKAKKATTAAPRAVKRAIARVPKAYSGQILY